MLHQTRYNAYHPKPTRRSNLIPLHPHCQSTSDVNYYRPQPAPTPTLKLVSTHSFTLTLAIARGCTIALSNGGSESLTLKHLLILFPKKVLVLTQVLTCRNPRANLFILTLTAVTHNPAVIITSAVSVRCSHQSHHDPHLTPG